MSEPFLGEIKIVSFNFPPKGWAFCNGQLLPINQNQGLFSLLGTTYGGDGRVNFGLPNLQGRVPIHIGPGFVLGQLSGEATHTLNVSELAAHNHPANGSTVGITTGSPANNYWGDGSATATNLYSNAAHYSADGEQCGRAHRRRTAARQSFALSDTYLRDRTARDISVADLTIEVERSHCHVEPIFG